MVTTPTTLYTLLFPMLLLLLLLLLLLTAVPIKLLTITIDKNLGYKYVHEARTKLHSVLLLPLLQPTLESADFRCYSQILKLRPRKTLIINTLVCCHQLHFLILKLDKATFKPT